MDKLPSIAQMVIRAQRGGGGHIQALKRMAEGQDPIPKWMGGEAGFAGWARGWRKVMATLEGWQVMTAEGKLTERGKELLSCLK